MHIIQHLNNKFSHTKELNIEFVSTPPYPMVVLDDFLPRDVALSLGEECASLKDNDCKKFDRNGSKMFEHNQMQLTPTAFDFVNQMHSSLGMRWLSEITGITDLIPDPYLTGAGYNKIYKNDCLKVHTDFNWNDHLKLHRILSLIVYLTPDWKEEYGGNLNFYDFKKQNLIQSIPPLFNRAIIWRYHKKGFHGSPYPITCPDGISRRAFRLFYYISNASHDAEDLPHRSLYWFDKELEEPYDIPTQK